MGSGGIAPGIPKLDIRQRWAVFYTNRPTDPGGKNPPYPVVRGRVHPTVGQQVVEKAKTSPPAGNLDGGSLLFQPLARMNYQHTAKTSHLNSLNASAADYLRSIQVFVRSSTQGRLVNDLNTSGFTVCNFVCIWNLTMRAICLLVSSLLIWSPYKIW